MENTYSQAIEIVNYSQLLFIVRLLGVEMVQPMETAGFRFDAVENFRECSIYIFCVVCVIPVDRLYLKLFDIRALTEHMW